MDKIFIRKGLLYHPELSHNGLMVYVSLRTRYFHNQYHPVTDWISYDYLWWTLTGLDAEAPKSTVKKLKEGLQNLNDIGEIKIISETKQAVKIEFPPVYYFNSDKDKTEPFVIIYQSEIYKIMQSDIKNKDRLLRHFCVMVSTINNASDGKANENGVVYIGGVGSQSIRYICDLAQVKPDAAIAYNEFLENSKMLVIMRSDSAIVDDYSKQIVSGFRNCYCRPEDRDKLEEYYNRRQEKSHIGTRQLGRNASEKRSNNAALAMWRKGITKDPDKLEKLTDHVSNLIYNLEADTNNIKKQTKLSEEDKLTILNNNNQIADYESQLSDLYWELFLYGDFDYKKPCSVLSPKMESKPNDRVRF